MSSENKRSRLWQMGFDTRATREGTAAGLDPKDAAFSLGTPNVQ